MTAITLRQHKYAVGAMTVLVALVTLLIWQSAVGNVSSDWESPVWYLFNAPTVLGGVFAVFWAAPLVSREYENRTHLFAWGQDVSPGRWLAAKVVVLAGIAAGLSAILGAFAHGAVLDPRTGYHPFDAQAFDSSPWLMAAHTLFGFGLGLLVGSTIRLTLPAMVLTLAVFLGVRWFVTVFVRPYYATPIREVWSLDVESSVPPGGRALAGGVTDAAGNPMAVPEQCFSPTVSARECARANGVAGHYSDYQPAERVPAFQLIETGVYLGLAAILFLLAFAWIRRRRRI